MEKCNFLSTVISLVRNIFCLLTFLTMAFNVTVDLIFIKIYFCFNFFRRIFFLSSFKINLVLLKLLKTQQCQFSKSRISRDW